MTGKVTLLIIKTFVLSWIINAQCLIDITQIEKLDIKRLTVLNTNYKGKDCIEAYLDSQSADEHFIGISGINFTNGTIELEVAGVPGKYADERAKGFVGIAFRIQNDSTFECIYLRPVNSISTDQLSRNHTVQYISHPDYPWHRLRRETPGKYESYCPVKPGEWIKMKIVVEGCKASLFVNDAAEPCLIVNDLKLGSDISGGIGLWVGSRTLARFTSLSIQNN